MVLVEQSCNGPDCNYSRRWQSQPYVGRMPAGNLAISSAILFAGGMISQSLRIFKILGMACIGSATYFRHQTRYLIPSVVSAWKEEQQHVIRSLKELNEAMVLSGDARSDSPGHCAKYGAYTVIEQHVNKVLDIQLVQVFFSADIHENHCLF